jgi:N-dimethylarginine dimethylaminohydrolase
MTPEDARLLIARAPPRRPGRTVAMCRPDGYRIAYAINPHMREADGSLKRADPGRALRQWEALAAAYRGLGLSVEIIPGSPDFPDMVFAANQTLPIGLPGGGKAVLLSNMHAPERRGEVALFEAWFKSRTFEIRRLPREEAGSFEGCGDLLWHPSKRLLFGGWGFRTTDRALEAIARSCEVPLIPLRLVDPRFYHLDTCLMPLDGATALAFRPAFEKSSWDLVAASFERILEPPEAEAAGTLACNVHCGDGKRVVIDGACEETVRMLESAGFEAIRVDTSEFLKAGGSVFCMTLAL